MSSTKCQCTTHSGEVSKECEYHFLVRRKVHYWSGGTAVACGFDEPCAPLGLACGDVEPRYTCKWAWVDCPLCWATTQARAAEILTGLRLANWSVACHNDYKLNGENYTFWLFTHPTKVCAKGEGPTDEEALLQVDEQVRKMTR